MARTKRIIECNCEDNDIPSLEEQFQDIMDSFDFKHVNMMMNWEYARADYNDEGECVGFHRWQTFHKPKEDFDVADIFDPANLRVPTVAELKKDAANLLKSVIRFAKANRRCKFYMTATGPFKASYRYGIIELECIFTSWSCD
jgi:hypothetical protein